jgi:hypothetical protein
VLQKYRYEIAAPDILNQKFQDWSWTQASTF